MRVCAAGRFVVVLRDGNVAISHAHIYSCSHFACTGSLSHMRPCMRNCAHAQQCPAAALNSTLSWGCVAHSASHTCMTLHLHFKINRCMIFTTDFRYLILDI